MIDPKLVTFLTLCKVKSFTKASELLYVTQPSVTHHIKTLEKYYNVKLLTSTNKNFALTKEGELLYTYALNLASFDAEFERIMADASKNVKRLLFSATPATSKAYLLPILSNFKEAHQDLICTININFFDTICEDILHGKIDFAIVDNTFPKKRFNAISLLKTKLIMAVGKNHPLAQIKKINFEKMLKENFILDLVGTGKRDFLTSNLKLKNHDITEFENIIEINDPNLTISMVKKGLGASVFYEAEIEDEIKNGSLIPIEITDIKDSIEFNLIYSKYHFDEENVKKIATEFQKIYRECNYLKYMSS